MRFSFEAVETRLNESVADQSLHIINPVTVEQS